MLQSLKWMGLDWVWDGNLCKHLFYQTKREQRRKLGERLKKGDYAGPHAFVPLW